MAATKRTPLKPKRTPTWLFEDIARTAGKLTLDREAGIIRHVKILGWQSDNGRDYDPEAGRAALRLYEGAKCFLNHPEPGRPHQPRKDTDAFGMFHAPVWESDGLYADLHYFKTHPRAATICEDVERGIGFFGMSHNARGDVERRGDREVVTKILEVRSVDLVTESASTTNLWEGRRMTTTVKQLIESNAKIKKETRVCLLEMGPDAMGSAYEAPMEEPEAEETGQSHLAKAIAALVQSDQNDDHELAMKVMKLLKPDAAGEEEEEVEEEDDEEEGDKKKPPFKEGKAGKKTAPGTVLTEARARKLAEVALAKPTKELIEALTGMDEDKALAVLKLTKDGGGKPSNAPRSSGPGGYGGKPLTEGKAAADAKEQVTVLLR